MNKIKGLFCYKHISLIQLRLTKVRKICVTVGAWVPLKTDSGVKFRCHSFMKMCKPRMLRVREKVSESGKNGNRYKVVHFQASATSKTHRYSPIKISYAETHNLKYSVEGREWKGTLFSFSCLLFSLVKVHSMRSKSFIFLVCLTCHLWNHCILQSLEMMGEARGSSRQPQAANMHGPQALGFPGSEWAEQVAQGLKEGEAEMIGSSI